VTCAFQGCTGQDAKLADKIMLDTLADNLLALFPIFHGRIFRPDHGISGMQLAGYRVLGTLMKCGPLPSSELARRLYISRPYITRLVDSLIKDNLVDRMPDEKDRRVIRIGITSDGVRKLKEARVIFHDEVVDYLAGLDDEDLVILNECLERVNKILAKQ
jgi:DNA-binding MarR family transcriptional regulator